MALKLFSFARLWREPVWQFYLAHLPKIIQLFGIFFFHKALITHPFSMQTSMKYTLSGITSLLKYKTRKARPVRPYTRNLHQHSKTQHNGAKQVWDLYSDKYCKVARINTKMRWHHVQCTCTIVYSWKLGYYGNFVYNCIFVYPLKFVYNWIYVYRIHFFKNLMLT